MARGLTKFPVIAPDGTEYRVSIKENTGLWHGDYAAVTIYTERKRSSFSLFRFKRLGVVTIRDKDGYDSDMPDYIATASKAIEIYEDSLRREVAHELILVGQRAWRKAAVAAFNEWDGQITEGGGEHR